MTTLMQDTSSLWLNAAFVGVGNVVKERNRAVKVMMTDRCGTEGEILCFCCKSRKHPTTSTNQETRLLFCRNAMHADRYRGSSDYTRGTPLWGWGEDAPESELV